MRTQVAIIGAGPAGLLLSHMLCLEGIDSIVIERQTKEHILQRIRAGVLEHGTVQLLREVGLGTRMDSEGHVHDGTYIAWQNRRLFLIDTKKYTGKQMMAYGQTAITEDLFRVRETAGAQIIYEVQNVTLEGLDTTTPKIQFVRQGETFNIECDFVAGCDGFQGVARRAVPASVLRTFERVYPFGWLGIVSETPPLKDIVYAHHERGFALASQRTPMLSRYYIQCPLETDLKDWSDDRFWTELKRRFPPALAKEIVTGPSIEKSIAPLRSFVAEPMQYGRLFLAGDASHIVPPTGAKGLNLAVSDVYYLQRALVQHFRKRDSDYLDTYSETALRRVWGAERLSWWLTILLHTFPNRDDFDTRINQNKFDYLCSSECAQASLAEQYIGAPYES
jgi:p-hydroxybenzoate 3-monooxygenase